MIPRRWVVRRRLRPAVRAIVVALLVLGGGCDDTSTDPDADQAFEGITETDDTGRILGRDPNDFLPRPLGDDDDNVAIPPQHPRAAPQNVSLIGVYPNPAPNGEVTITFQLTGTAHVDLLLYPGPGEDPLSLLSESRGAGFHQELYVAPILGVISRVELRVNANVFGGDIQF